MLIESVLAAFASWSAGMCPVSAPAVTKIPPANTIAPNPAKRIIAEIMRVPAKLPI